MSENIKLSYQFNKEKFLSSDQSQLIYLLIEAMPGTNSGKRKVPLNLCLLMDRSASMKGSKIENVKQAICHIIDDMTSDDCLSMIAFNEEAEILIPAQFVRDKNSLKEKVGQMTAEGGTALSSGLKLGLDEILTNISDDRLNRIILLTDGQTYGDEEACYQLASKAASIGVKITALGVGEQWHEELLDTIAEGNNGHSDYIATADAIKPIFQREMETIKSIVATNCVLKCRFTEEVHFRKICKVIPYISDLEYTAGNDLNIHIGDLDKEVGMSFLIEMIIQSTSTGRFRISQIELSYDIPSQNLFGQTVKADIFVSLSAAEADCQRMNPKVMNIIEKVSAYDLQTHAIQQAVSGDVKGATQRLKAAATRLLKLGEAELADATLKEIKNLERDGSMTSSGTKKLKYETRRITQLSS